MQLKSVPTYPWSVTYRRSEALCLARALAGEPQAACVQCVTVEVRLPVAPLAAAGWIRLADDGSWYRTWDHRGPSDGRRVLREDPAAGRKDGDLWYPWGDTVRMDADPTTEALAAMLIASAEHDARERAAREARKAQEDSEYRAQREREKAEREAREMAERAEREAREMADRAAIREWIATHDESGTDLARYDAGRLGLGAEVLHRVTDEVCAPMDHIPRYRHITTSDVAAADVKLTERTYVGALSAPEWSRLEEIRSLAPPGAEITPREHAGYRRCENEDGCDIDHPSFGHPYAEKRSVMVTVLWHGHLLRRHYELPPID